MTAKKPRNEGIIDPKTNEVLRKLLGTPPQPRKPKAKEEKPEE